MTGNSSQLKKGHGCEGKFDEPYFKALNSVKDLREKDSR